MEADIGLVGLGVMGESLVINIANHGFKVVGYNRTEDRVNEFINGRGKHENISGAYTLKELTEKLKKPRIVLLMIKAGKPVDDVIEKLLPLLEKDDIIIDGGNSHFTDTIRRTKYLKEKSVHFVGTGVSGGEEGALKGPSIMPGGSSEAWKTVKPILQSIAAKVKDGTPCCDWVGEDGSGHFVKMVHNGIEYADMQLISEAYFIMRNLLEISPSEMSVIFKEWNQGELDSYLIEITSDILSKKGKDGNPFIDYILDAAQQKGTGKWSVQSALDVGDPLTLIGEAVFARVLSSLKVERVEASKVLKADTKKREYDKNSFIIDIRNALYASKIVAYAQGFSLMKAAAKEYDWDLDYGRIALMWREGCIIRSVFLEKIKDAFDKNKELTNLLLDDFFKSAIDEIQDSWRRVISEAALSGIPVPAFSSALAYYDGYRRENLPANLLQAQRDYFGSHTYERVDQPRGMFYHNDWLGDKGENPVSKKKY
jgi:6-phosphogluconate dehydrogenase